MQVSFSQGSFLIKSLIKRRDKMQHSVKKGEAYTYICMANAIYFVECGAVILQRC